MKMIVPLLLGCLSVSCASCASIERKPFTENPTEYTFNASFRAVVDAVANLHLKSDRFIDFSAHETTGPKNSVTFDIRNFGNAVNIYYVYYVDGKPAKYWSDFKVTITAINELRTRAKVVAFNSGLFIPGHGLNIHTFEFNQSSMVSVKPTTIEEYEILLALGLEVKESGMPLLHTPKI